MQQTIFALILIVVSFLGASPAYAATAPAMSGVSHCGVLAYSTVTNGGPSVVSGDLCLSPGSSVTGFPPGVVTGAMHVADASANTAHTAWVNAYNNLSGQGCNFNLATAALTGSLIPGVYCNFSSVGNITFTSSSVYVFQASSTLITAVGSTMTGGDGCNVFWRVPSSATIGGGSTFVGNILASTSIAVQSGANVRGRVLANTGAVTLQSAHVGGGCAGSGALYGCNYSNGVLDGRIDCRNGDRIAVWCDSAVVQVLGITPAGQGFFLTEHTYGDLLSAGPDGITDDLGLEGSVWMSVVPVSATEGSFTAKWSGSGVRLGNYPSPFDTFLIYNGTIKASDFAKTFFCPLR